MSELVGLSAREIAARVRSGSSSAREVIDAHLARIDALEPRVNAFITVAGAQARERARVIDARIARGDEVGPLAGVPAAIKDNLTTRGLLTTCASRILENHRPLYDATAVARLVDAGAIVVGKTNLDEFAMGSSTENSYFGPTRNPWDLDRVPGGSSGGSAAAVAARMAPIALGSDTGGSVRQPGALTGVVALKPTYGVVSRFGLVAFASSLDQVGVFARSVGDAALVLDVVAGADPNDATCAPAGSPLRREELEVPVGGLRIGVPRRLLARGVDPDVTAAFEASLETLAGLGAVVSEIEMMDPSIGISTYYIVAGAEASSNLARYDGVRYGHRADASELVDMYASTRREGFGTEVKRRVLLGTYVLSSGYYDAYYNRAMKVRRLIRDDLDRSFASVDVIAMPTTPAPAFRIGEKIDDPLQMYLSDLFTIAANLSSYPALSVPAGLTPAGLPVGFQLLGGSRREGMLLRAGGALLRASGHDALVPPEIGGADA